MLKYFNPRGGDSLKYAMYVCATPMVLVQFAFWVWKRPGIDFVHFGLESGMVFEETSGV